jgi:hypothetical protein
LLRRQFLQVLDHHKAHKLLDEPLFHLAITSVCCNYASACARAVLAHGWPLPRTLTARSHDEKSARPSHGATCCRRRCSSVECALWISGMLRTRQMVTVEVSEVHWIRGRDALGVPPLEGSPEYVM